MEKIIHQIWIGSFQIPQREKQYTIDICNSHPDFKYIFWNNDNFPILPNKFKDLVQYYFYRKQWVHIADFLRYWVIKEYGGMYIDVDYELISPIHSLNVQDIDGILPLHFNSGETICNSIFGFKKNHPLMTYIIESMEALSPTSNTWLGPNFFGKNIKKYLGFVDSNLDIEIFNELQKQNIYTPHSRLEFQKKYMIHHLSYNWNEENQQKLQIDKNFEVSTFSKLFTSSNTI